MLVGLNTNEQMNTVAPSNPELLSCTKLLIEQSLMSHFLIFSNEEINIHTLDVIIPTKPEFFANFEFLSVKAANRSLSNPGKFSFKDGLNNSRPNDVASPYFSNSGISRGNFQMEVVFHGILAAFQPPPGLSPVLGRTHSCAPINFPRTIHKFDSANSVTSWAVFFFKPR